jgi:hypothetical protein
MREVAEKRKQPKRTPAPRWRVENFVSAYQMLTEANYRVDFLIFITRKLLKKLGERAGPRTQDPLIKSQE